MKHENKKIRKERKNKKTRRKLTMGILKTLVIGAAGAAIGVGIGYSVFKPSPVNCQQVYKTELAALEDKYKGIETPSGIAAAKDFSLDYVVKQDSATPFKGMILTDSTSGDMCAITKTAFFSKSNYDVACSPEVKQLLAGKTDSVKIEPQLKDYAATQPKP